jgi:acetyl-CoA carboxylase biotin carboxyl carrier protein
MNEDSIVKLMDKFSAADIAELDIQEGALHIVFRKDAAVRSVAASDGQTVFVPGGGQAADAVHLGLPGAASGGAAGETITSPIVATFYAAPGPDAPVFVKAGSRVKAGDTLCILEAMKMMNKLEAEFNCEILAVKAESGDMVEYGQPLFEVKRL